MSREIHAHHDLRASSHVERLTRTCTCALHVLRMLRARRLPENILQKVHSATVISCLLFAVSDGGNLNPRLCTIEWPSPQDETRGCSSTQMIICCQKQWLINQSSIKSSFIIDIFVT